MPGYDKVPQFPAKAPLPFRRTIRRHELHQIVPLAETTIYELEQRGEFPRRFRLTARCVVWDLEDDPDGNYVHIVIEHGITQDEVEEVVGNPRNPTVASDSSGRPLTFGWTSSGRHLGVVEVRVWPWLCIRSFHLLVGGEVLYAEGQRRAPEQTALPAAWVDEVCRRWEATGKVSREVTDELSALLPPSERIRPADDRTRRRDQP